jgi:hypothetical protein
VSQFGVGVIQPCIDNADLDRLVAQAVGKIPNLGGAFIRRMRQLPMESGSRFDESASFFHRGYPCGPRGRMCEMNPHLLDDWMGASPLTVIDVAIGYS